MQPQDVYDTLTLAQMTIDGPNWGSNSLKVVEFCQHKTITCDTNSNSDGNSNSNFNGESSDDESSSSLSSPFDGPCQFFWAIYGGAILNSWGATPNRVLVIQQTLKDFFEECDWDDYDNASGDRRKSSWDSHPTTITTATATTTTTTNNTTSKTPPLRIYVDTLLYVSFVKKETRTEK